MARKKIILQNEFPYHVYNRALDKEFFGIPMPDLWYAFQSVLNQCMLDYGVKVQAFVLMSNHFHLLVTTPNENLSLFMQIFQSKVAKFISRKLGKKSYRFEARYKWSMVTNPQRYTMVFSYVYLNPVRANICQQSADYRYSTLYSLARSQNQIIKVSQCDLVPELDRLKGRELANFVDLSRRSDLEEKIRRGLRRKVFEISKR
jgi:putative transposase